MMKRAHTVSGLLAGAALAGMGTPASALAASHRADPPTPAPHAQAAPHAQTRDYIFTYLVLDEPESLSEEQMGEAMQGHFANMGVMAQAGDLLIAGPLADPRIEETYRGIFVFSTPDPDRGGKLFASDPAVRAGVFKPEMYRITTAQPLFELTRLEEEYEQRRLADPDIPDEWVGRMYILAIAPAQAALADESAVLIDATMDRIDDDPDDHAPRRLLWVDAQDPQTAAKRLQPDNPAQWTYLGWYGSPCVAELAKLAAPLTDE